MSDEAQTSPASCPFSLALIGRRQRERSPAPGLMMPSAACRRILRVKLPEAPPPPPPGEGDTNRSSELSEQRRRAAVHPGMLFLC